MSTIGAVSKYSYQMLYAENNTNLAYYSYLSFLRPVNCNVLIANMREENDGQSILPLKHVQTFATDTVPLSLISCIGLIQVLWNISPGFFMLKIRRR